MATAEESAGRSLDQWLEYWTQQHSKTIDLGLERVGKVAERLGLPAKGLAPKLITVAGTNGKGSTVAMLEACVRAHGLSTVSYSSPHLLRYNERIRINGQDSNDDQLIQAFKQIETARLESPEISLSYFEVGTLAAALLIRSEQPDVAIMEVGLGGRLDAVNLFDADVAIISTIALDHADYLGTDISVIGREKAGIMRKGQSVVLGSRDLPSSVSEYAQEVGVAHIASQGTDFFHKEGGNLDTLSDIPSVTDQKWSWSGVDSQKNSLSFAELPDPHLPLDNAASAIQGLVYAGLELDQASLIKAFATVSLPGRMQRMGRWLLDVAHNPQAAQYIASRLEVSARRNHGAPKRIALLGMLGDKDAAEVIKSLNPVIEGWVCVGLEGERGRSGDALAQEVEKQGGKILSVCNDVNEGLDWIQSTASLNEYEVLVCGSFLTVAAALEWLEVR